MFKSRFVMFTASSLWIALILVVLVFRGGGAVPVESHEPRPASVPAAVNPGAAAALLEQGDYEGSARLYREALAGAPDDLALSYGLGVALSHLNQRGETEEAFQRVVNRGASDTAEVRQARQWLVSAGVLAPTVSFAPTREAPEATRDRAVVQGKVAWSGAAGPLKTRVLLHGVSGPAEGKRFVARLGLGESYRFERLPAGSYRLIGVVGDKHLWDLTVDVEDGQQVTRDLTRDNSGTPSVSLAGADRA